MGVMNIFRIPLNAIMVILLGLIEVQQLHGHDSCLVHRHSHTHLPLPPFLPPLGVMNIFRIPLNAIMVILLGLIEVKQISMGTTLALCTVIHGVGLVMYWNFERSRKHLASAEYSPVTSIGSGSESEGEEDS